MSEKKYDVTITSVEPQAELTLLSAKLGKALRKNPQQIEFALNEIASLNGADFTIIQGIPETKAKQLQTYLAKQGLSSELRTEITLEEIEEVNEFCCPACGHAQKVDPNGDDICEKCGVIAKKYAQVQKRKAIFESEHRYHEALQQMKVDQLQKSSAALEEERLREEAREKLGIRKKQATSIALIIAFLAICSTVVLYIYYDQLFPAEQIVANDDQTLVNSKSKKQALLSISPSGGNIVINAPSAASSGAEPTMANSAAASTIQANVVTKENTEGLSDTTTQNIALQMHNQTQEAAANSIEPDVKAEIMAYGIDSDSSRSAVLKMLNSEDEVAIDNTTSQQLRKGVNELTQDKDPLFLASNTRLITSLENEDFVQALDAVEMVNDSYQKSILLYQVIQSEIEHNKSPQLIDSHILQLAKWLEQEKDLVTQIKIQSLLSAAYSLSGEKKASSLNLIIAIEKLHKIQSTKLKTELLCLLSRDQRISANINQAKSLLKLAEVSANKLSPELQSKAYNSIVKQYAKALDFTTAMQLSEKITQTDLLQDALNSVIAIQNKYMGIS